MSKDASTLLTELHDEVLKMKHLPSWIYNSLYTYLKKLREHIQDPEELKLVQETFDHLATVVQYNEGENAKIATAVSNASQKVKYGYAQIKHETTEGKIKDALENADKAKTAQGQIENVVRSTLKRMESSIGSEAVRGLEALSNQVQAIRKIVDGWDQSEEFRRVEEALQRLEAYVNSKQPLISPLHKINLEELYRNIVLALGNKSRILEQVLSASDEECQTIVAFLQQQSEMYGTLFQQQQPVYSPLGTMTNKEEREALQVLAVTHRSLGASIAQFASQRRLLAGEKVQYDDVISQYNTVKKQIANRNTPFETRLSNTIQVLGDLSRRASNLETMIKHMTQTLATIDQLGVGADQASRQVINHAGSGPSPGGLGG